MKNWQRTQKKALNFIGAEEHGHRGKKEMDGIHPCFVVEVKHEDKLPKWATDGLKQAERYAKKRKIDKPPLLIVKQKGKHIKNAIAVMRLKDFRDYLGELQFNGLGIA